MSTPYERLMAEAIPVRPAPAAPRGPWTPEEQDRHWNDLCHFVGTPGAKRPEQPHLRLIDGQGDTEAA